MNDLQNTLDDRLCIVPCLLDLREKGRKPSIIVWQADQLCYYAATGEPLLCVLSPDEAFLADVEIVLRSEVQLPNISSASATAFNIPLALLTVSMNSLSGMESATIPAPD